MNGTLRPVQSNTILVLQGRKRKKVKQAFTKEERLETGFKLEFAGWIRETTARIICKDAKNDGWHIGET